MNSFSFTFSGKHFIYPSILNDGFAKYRTLLFTTLNTSCESLIACKIYFHKSADSRMGTPLYVINCFSLAAFKIFSLSLTFDILIMMWHGVVFFVSILFGALCASWTCMSISFTKLRSFIIFSNKFSISCYFCSPSGIPMIQMLEHLNLSQRFLSLSSSFFKILFSSCCSD